MNTSTATQRRVALSKAYFVLGILILSLGGTTPLISGAFAQKTTAQEQPLPLSPIELAEKNGTALRLSLKDLTKLALQNNLDIAISDTNEEYYQQKVIQSYGPYDPVLGFGLGTSIRKSPNTNRATQALGSNFNQTDQAFWNLNFKQNIRTGADIQFDYRSSRSDTNQAFALFTPQYNASTLITFTQPLWRNFKTDRNRNAIRLANLDTKTNDSQFKQKVVDTIAKLQGKYWDLVAAIRDYEIKRESVKLAQITLNNNKKKVEIGTLAPIAITEARADMSSREQDMIVAEEKIFTTQNDIKAMVSNDRNAEIWQKTIVPTETPDFKETKVNLDQAIDTAFKNRPELEQLQIKLDKTDLDYALTSNLKRWQLDFVGAFGTYGVAGPQVVNGVSTQFDGTIGRAYQLLFTGGFTTWSVGFNLEIPLRNRTLETKLATTKIEKRQHLMDRKVQEQKIVVDVRNAVQALETNKKRVETAKVARELAEEQLEGETKRFQAGLSENFRVLGRQRDLSVAQGTELKSLIDYKKSVIDLQKAIYTLLESNDFEIAKTSSDNVK